MDQTKSLSPTENPLLTKKNINHIRNDNIDNKVNHFIIYPKNNKDLPKPFRKKI